MPRHRKFAPNKIAICGLSILPTRLPFGLKIVSPSSRPARQKPTRRRQKPTRSSLQPSLDSLYNVKGSRRAPPSLLPFFIKSTDEETNNVRKMVGVRLLCCRCCPRLHISTHKRRTRHRGWSTNGHRAISSFNRFYTSY